MAGLSRQALNFDVGSLLSLLLIVLYILIFYLFYTILRRMETTLQEIKKALESRNST